ncbi:MAG TPA: hypothetical protein VGA64_02390 [Candidatus Polarisedimenticolia bacterium]
MKEAKRVAQLGGGPTLLMMTLGLLLLPACSKNDNTTLVNSGVDCGLVRADLTGTWQVVFTSDSVLTTNCNNSSFNNTSITVNALATNYSGVSVQGSDTSASFLVTGDGSDAAVNPELIGSVQADSCLALFRVWDSADKAYIQCLGTFDRTSGTIAAGCDSVDIDNPVGGSIESICDLNPSISVAVSVL